jgi:hypothetical protein
MEDGSMSAKISILTLLVALCVVVAAQPIAIAQKTAQKKRSTEKAGDQTTKVGASRSEGASNQNIKVGASRTEGTSNQTAKVGTSNPNNTGGAGVPGIEALVAVSQAKVNNANQGATNGADSQGKLVKKESQLKSGPIKTTAITPPASSIQADPNQPTRKKKSTAPHRP